MKSIEMQISVYRRGDGTPSFRYPKDWDGEKAFEQICELCATLQEELDMEQAKNCVLRRKLDQIKEELK